MEKKWYTVTFSAKMSDDDVRAMKKCFYDAMEEGMWISECANLNIELENEEELTMTNERKVELFDKAMDWIYRQLVYADRLQYEETLEEIGFTDEEIAEELRDIFAENDEEE